VNSRFNKNLVRTAGALVGAGLALIFLLAARPDANSSPLPATVRVSVAPTGELEVLPSPPRPVLVANALLPGRPPAAATFQIRNQAGRTLAVALSTTADSTALDGLVRIRLSADGHRLADTTLQGMQERSVDLNLASGARTQLQLQAWIPGDVLTGYEGRLVEVSLVPAVQPLGGRG
jgi:hypothetical protein